MMHIFSNKYDVILIHGYQTFSAWLILMAAKLQGIKVMLRGEAIPKKQNTNWKNIFFQKIIKVFLFFCDAVIYSCSQNKEYWSRLNVSEDKMFFAPCAVDNEFFQKEKKRNLSERAELRHQLGIHEVDFVVLFSARFTSRKRPLDLIEAIAKINHTNVVMLFIGDGLEREAMEVAVKHHGIRAIFTGFLNQKELSRYYVLADMFAIVSSYDASPKALNEAMNFAIPVVCSEGVGTAHDLVRNGENGFVVPVGDIDAISKSIWQLFNDRKLSRQMGMASSNIVVDWNLKNAAKAILQAAHYSISVR